MDAYEFVGDWSGQLIATSIHAGHDLRPEIAELSILAEDDRFREEDPFTDRIASLAPARVLVHRSRFETDLNRVREKTVYRRPEDAWGLRMWSLDPLPDDVVARSLEVYDSFFAALAERLDEVAARGPFVLFDVHAYNHRRHGEEADAEPWEHDDVEPGGGQCVRRGRAGGVHDAERPSGHRLQQRPAAARTQLLAGDEHEHLRVGPVSLRGARAVHARRRRPWARDDGGRRGGRRRRDRDPCGRPGRHPLQHLVRSVLDVPARLTVAV